MKRFNYPRLISLTAFNDLSLPASFIKNILTPQTATSYVFKSLRISFIERLENYLLQIADLAYRSFFLNAQMDRILREEGNITDLPPLRELSQRSELVILNYDPVIDTPQQLPSNIIAVGGLQIKPAKPLTDVYYFLFSFFFLNARVLNDLIFQHIQAILDNAKNGLILFSLGTNVRMSNLGEKNLVMILEAFRKIPQYTVLCKIDLDKLPVSLPKNVHILKWVPQNDVLGK